MSKAASTKSVKGKDAGGLERRPRDSVSRPAISGAPAQVLNLQRTIGNRAISKLLQSRVADSQRSNEVQARETSASPSGAEQPKSDSHSTLLHRANADSGQPLDESVRSPLERNLGINLSGARVHSGPSSEAAAESLGARAYTIGSNIFLGPAARNLNTGERKQLLAHEAVHTVQQGGQPVALQGKFEVSHPGDHAEIEADRVADAVISGREKGSSSPALSIRNSMRVTPVASSIQRDITDTKKLKHGELKIDFKKTDGTAAGDPAQEDGAVTYTPSATAPESDSIKFVQIVRTIDVAGVTTAAGDPVDYAKVGKGEEAARNKMYTKGNAKKNIEGGFFIDQQAASLAKRTTKAQKDVPPYYDETGPPLAGNKVGVRRGKTITPAVLVDTPLTGAEIKFDFVTSAKASDTGTWYGTVLWGFETFRDKAGITKIKGEYKSFGEDRGATTDAALKTFDEFYRNKGASTAPTK